MPVTKNDVEKIARLARLELKENEIENYTTQLNQILEYMEKLNELDTENIEPLSHPVENINVFREDLNVPSISREEALMNAPGSTEEFFKVPKVIKIDS